MTVTACSAASMAAVSARTAAGGAAPPAAARSSSRPIPAAANAANGVPTSHQGARAEARLGVEGETDRQDEHRRVASSAAVAAALRVLSISASSAMRAAPVLSGVSAGSLWLWPSGKRHSTPPPASTRRLAAKVSALRAGSTPASLWR